MNLQNKSLALGILTGIMISLLLFEGGIIAYKQFSSIDLKIPANLPTSITYEGMSFNFTYYPDIGKVTTSSDQPKDDGFPANIGVGGSWWTGAGYRIAEVNSDYIIMHFRSGRFLTLDDVTVR
jgi:hypothetical protein